MKKAIFLDRDGTLNVDIHYAHKKEDCKLVEQNIWKILQKFREAGYLLIITTNQAGIDKWYYGEEDFWSFMKELENQLDIVFDATYFCPFHPDFSGEKPCRKPNNGMILQAKKEFDIDLKASFMIGDNEKDVISGKKSGCTTILINTNDFDVESFASKPNFAVDSWEEIKSIILPS